MRVCSTVPKTGIAAWRICRYNLRWAINPAGYSPRHTNKVPELVSKLVVHSSIIKLVGTAQNQRGRLIDFSMLIGNFRWI